MNHNQAPQPSRNELALRILNFIDRSTATRRLAAELTLPWQGSVLGARQSMQEMAVEEDLRAVNEALAALNGIQAVIGDHDSGDRLRLLEWRGPDAEEPGAHHWLVRGSDGLGEASIGLDGLLQDLQNGLPA